jgi:hypothetical protein
VLSRKFWCTWITVRFWFSILKFRTFCSLLIMMQLSRCSLRIQLIYVLEEAQSWPWCDWLWQVCTCVRATGGTWKSGNFQSSVVSESSSTKPLDLTKAVFAFIQLSISVLWSFLLLNRLLSWLRFLDYCLDPILTSFQTFVFICQLPVFLSLYHANLADVEEFTLITQLGWW